MNSSHRCKILFLAAVSSGFESVCRLFLNGLSKNVTVGGRIGGRFYWLFLVVRREEMKPVPADDQPSLMVRCSFVPAIFKWNFLMFENCEMYKMAVQLLT